MEKRAKAGVKNKRPMARPAKREKHNKTHGFRHMFEERADENDEQTALKQARNRSPAARKTRENAWFL